MFIANFDFQSFHDGPGARLKILDTSLFFARFFLGKIPGPKILGFRCSAPRQMGVCWGHGRAFTFKFSASAACLFSTLNSHRFSCHGVTWDSHGAATIQSSRVHDEKKIPHIEHVFSTGVGRVFVMQGKQAGSCPLTLSHQACFVSALGSVHVATGGGWIFRSENLSTSNGSLGGGSGDCAFALMEKESGSHRPTWKRCNKWVDVPLDIAWKIL